MKFYIVPECKIEIYVENGDVLTLSASFYDDYVTAPEDWFKV